MWTSAVPASRNGDTGRICSCAQKGMVTVYMEHAANMEDHTQTPHLPDLFRVKSVNRRGHEVSRAMARRCRRCQCRCLPGTACGATGVPSSVAWPSSADSQAHNVIGAQLLPVCCQSAAQTAAATPVQVRSMHLCMNFARLCASLQLCRQRTGCAPSEPPPAAPGSPHHSPSTTAVHYTHCRRPVHALGYPGSQAKSDSR